MRIERQIDAGRAECRAAYAKAGRLHASTSSQMHNGNMATDSSGLENSDSDIDLGGPEMNAPLPDNDQTVNDVEADDEGQNGREDEQIDYRRFRRAGSAPISKTGSPESSRKRRRRIMSSLGLTSDQPRVLTSPTASKQGNFDFDLGQHAEGAGVVFVPNASEGPGVSTGYAQSEKKLRRRLSTGQLWLGRRNKKNTAAANAFGSGVSDDDVFSTDEIESERSFEKH